MLEMIRKPPPYFKEVIQTHFRQKREQITYQTLKWYHEIGQAVAASAADGLPSTDDQAKTSVDEKKHGASKTHGRLFHSNSPLPTATPLLL